MGANLWIRHEPSIAHARLVIDELGRTPAQGEGRGRRAAGDGTYASRVRQPDLGEEQANSDARGRLNGGGDDLDEPLAHARERHDDEDDALDKDGGKGRLVRDGAAAVDADNLEGEVGVEAHSRTVIATWSAYEAEWRVIRWLKGGLTRGRQAGWWSDQR